MVILTEKGAKRNSVFLSEDLNVIMVMLQTLCDQTNQFKNTGCKVSQTKSDLGS